jgi:phosphotransferase system HPr-like phosphotransfer protein
VAATEGRARTTSEDSQLTPIRRDMSTLLRDVIAIPERAGAEDYVLRLTEGVQGSHRDQTVADYVVTEQLATSFDQALDLVVGALRDNNSRAAFLHGSFGSGKSHFMAVLYALLGHDVDAWSKEKLAPVVNRHDQDLTDKKILRLAYHFLDADAVEDCILGGYVEQIRALHPDCLLPAVHASDGLLADAEGLRTRMGDETFFGGLGPQAATGADAKWSTMLAGVANWSRERYDAARAAAPGSDARQELVTALVATYFPNSFAVKRGAQYVSLDEGLAAISRHAKGLGYDAVVLFLDELVLWLTFLVRDHQKFSREAQKLTKLVESTAGERAVPLVSFVARQMDLRQYFGEHGGGPGSERQSLEDAFRHQEGRFASITLGDDNLPYVAQQRLLRPKNDGAEQVLNNAFDSLDRRSDVWDTLLDGMNTDDRHRGADQRAFRLTYPFSPALVSTLRALASVMQRDRTALKVMQQILVQQRDTLTVDDVIPVGDLFDLVVHGSQPITSEMAGRFTNARTLYVDKLRPLLLRDHALTEELASGLDGQHPFLADDRLMKTLVLAAIAPEVPALKELTATRLAALNHGSITSPLPGAEASVVLRKVNRWSLEVPDLRVGTGQRNPVIRLGISEVDWESILDRARTEDSAGGRRNTLKQLVWEAFGFADTADDAFGVHRHNILWRGSRREVEIVFGNVRDREWLPDARFEATSDTWRFVVDYPMDEDGKSARDDLARLDDLRSHLSHTTTLVWLPRFLHPDRLDELGKLVVLNHVLSSDERYRLASDHLGDVDRIEARRILENLRDNLRERLRRAIQEAYGVARETPNTLVDDASHQKVLISLNAELQPESPVGADLAGAFGQLIDQAFSTLYPGHPRFGSEEIRPRDLSTVLRYVRLARQDPDGRVPVEPRDREIAGAIVAPLGLGHVSENALLFESSRFIWATEINRAFGREGIGGQDTVTVGDVRRWLAAREPSQGLRPEVADLVVLAWAELADRSVYRGGVAQVPAPEPAKLTADMELRAEPMPDHQAWQQAVDLAQHLFGAQVNPYLTTSSVNQLVADVLQQVRLFREPAADLVAAVTTAYQQLGLEQAEPGRLATATSANQLMIKLNAAVGDRVEIIRVLATHNVPSTKEALGRSLISAPAAARQLSTFEWDRLGPLLKAESAADARGTDAHEALDRLRRFVRAEELASPIARALLAASNDLFTWLASQAKVVPPIPPGPTPPPPVDRETSATVRSTTDLDEAIAAVRDYVSDHPGRPVTIHWRVES